MGSFSTRRQLSFVNFIDSRISVGIMFLIKLIFCDSPWNPK
jgi:hypothetical protein